MYTYNPLDMSILYVETDSSFVKQWIFYQNRKVSMVLEGELKLEVFN